MGAICRFIAAPPYRPSVLFRLRLPTAAAPSGFVTVQTCTFLSFFFFFYFFFFFPVDLASLPSRRRDTRPFQKARQVTRRRGCYSYLRVDAGVESNGNGVTSLPSKYEKIGWKNNQRAEYSISRFTRYTCKL